MDMVYLYRIDEKYKEIITYCFPDKGINDIKKFVGENESGSEVEEIVLFLRIVRNLRGRFLRICFPK